MAIGKSVVVDVIVSIVILLFVYYFVRVADNLFLAAISFIVGIGVILGLRHVMRKSGMKVYQTSYKWRVNTLRPEYRVAIMLFSGMLFAGIVIGVIRVFAGWLPIYIHVPLVILSGVIGAIIGDTLRKILQKQ
ncbi:MAG: hypothetical protein LBH79_00195 [Nitrososphaerota archaeon]|nr:hypothetical protein [Nitrososphaerota archaeon]